jgi:glycosyltransferase involved in cell wall biosynthesis
MACGVVVPLILVVCGVCYSGRSSVMVAPQNPQALADTVIRVLRDESLRQHLIRGLKKSEFSWEKVLIF